MVTKQGAEAAGDSAPAVGRLPASGPNGSARPTREQVIADLVRMDAKPSEPTTAEEPLPEAAEREEPIEPAQDEDPAEERAEAAPEPSDELPDAGKDPDLAKRLAIVAKHEKRAKEREAKAKAALEERESELRRRESQIEREIETARSEIGAFAKLKERAKYDPAGVLRSLGLGEDDLGPAARQLWAHTKENLADPKNREAAERMMRERESMDRIAKLEREIEERKKAEGDRDARERAARQAEQYLDGISKAIKPEDHPLARRLVEKSPGKARARFAAIAYELSERDDGDVPDAEDVLAEYERRRRAELEEDGVDVAAMLKPRTAAPKADGPRTLGNDIGTATAAKPSGNKKTMAEKRAELEAELRAMDLKGR